VTPLERIVRNAVAAELRPAQSPAPPTALTAGAREAMTADELSTFLGVHRNTVYEAASRGEIPHARLGRRLVFSRSAVMSCLAACNVRVSGKGK
jgi:excisionase family DNA binding protein